MLKRGSAKCHHSFILLLFVRAFPHDHFVAQVDLSEDLPPSRSGKGLLPRFASSEQAARQFRILCGAPPRALCVWRKAATPFVGAVPRPEPTESLVAIMGTKNSEDSLSEFAACGVVPKVRFHHLLKSSSHTLICNTLKDMTPFPGVCYRQSRSF